MRWLTLFFLIIALPGFAQAKRGETKISQQLKPDCSIRSTVIITKVFARENQSEDWVKIYEAEVAFAKTEQTKEVKRREQEKAEIAARRWEAGDPPEEQQVARAEPAFTK